MKENHYWTLTIKVYHACFENAPQAVLQLYVIIITWGSINKHAYQDPLIIRKMTMAEDLYPSNEQLDPDCLLDVWEGEQNNEIKLLISVNNVSPHQRKLLPTHLCHPWSGGTVKGSARLSILQYQ